jgi:glycerophosphoryl diester phosphodiesterase
MATGLLVEAPLDGDPVDLAREVGAGAVFVEDPLADPELLAAASSAGLDLWVWTVNDEGRLGELLGSPLVAGVITDVPERAVAIRASLAVGEAR